MTLEVYGIPTCSSCKNAMKWLESQSIAYIWINTRQNPPTKEQIHKWVQEIGSKVMKNTSGGSYRALGEEKKTWSDTQWVEAFSNDPMLLKRPLFVQDGQALCTGFRKNGEELAQKITKK